MTVAAQVAQLGTILVLGAHPDDESWLAAGLMLLANQNNQRVVCVTATKGEQGSRDPLRWPAEQIGKVRQQELAAACKVLGIEEQYWLGYQDGQCKNVSDQEVTRKMVPLLHLIQPDTLITFGPDGKTGHDDHKAVCRWASVAVRAAQLAHPVTILHSVESKEWYERIGQKWGKQNGVYFNISHPIMVPEANADLCLRLSPELIEQKLAAIRCHISQYEAMFAHTSPAQMRDAVSCECFMVASRSFS